MEIHTFFLSFFLPISLSLSQDLAENWSMPTTRPVDFGRPSVAAKNTLTLHDAKLTKSDPKVARALRRWWNCVSDNRRGQMPLNSLATMCKIVADRMFGPVLTVEDVLVAVKRAWDISSSLPISKLTVSELAFYDGFYRLLHNWSDGASPDSLASFVDELFADLQRQFRQSDMPKPVNGSVRTFSPLSFAGNRYPSTLGERSSRRRIQSAPSSDNRYIPLQDPLHSENERASGPRTVFDSMLIQRKSLLDRHAVFSRSPIKCLYSLVPSSVGARIRTSQQSGCRAVIMDIPKLMVTPAPESPSARRVLSNQRTVKLFIRDSVESRFGMFSDLESGIFEDNETEGVHPIETICMSRADDSQLTSTPPPLLETTPNDTEQSPMKPPRWKPLRPTTAPSSYRMTGAGFKCFQQKLHKQPQHDVRVVADLRHIDLMVTNSRLLCDKRSIVEPQVPKKRRPFSSPVTRLNQTSSMTSASSTSRRPATAHKVELSAWTST
eukprot:GILJ01005365.1.p1 GENE.GILJ01005365.1~~GILJ01005365.1.p1  ORF type:complete len:494 (+),score=31.87 GILJ01005365.1:492-1973(+)